VALGQFEEEARQTRDSGVAKNATLRAARPDPSLRKSGLLRMTIKLTHHRGCSPIVKSLPDSTRRDSMRRLSALILLAILSVNCSAMAHAQAHARDLSQARAARKADKKQQKAMKKYAKAQRKAQRRMIKQDRKNTRYPSRRF